MTTPAYTPAEARTRETFLALMWALSYPGRPQTLPSVESLGSFELIAETLLDLETSYFTPDPALATRLEHSGARALPADRAAYHFYPAVTDAELAHIRQASAGTLLYPDEAATLVIGCTIGTGKAFTLHGPGTAGETSVLLGGLPGAFWSLRASVRFPLGWDVFLVDGQQVLGLPRSTTLAQG